VSERKITILPAKDCRRSRKIVEYLESHAIRFTRIALESEVGRALAEQHTMRASPGILVDGVSVNPFDVVIQGECRMDEEAANRLLLGDRTE